MYVDHISAFVNESVGSLFIITGGRDQADREQHHILLHVQNHMYIYM